MVGGLEHKIGESEYRTVYQVDTDKCAKFLKTHRQKKYGPITVSYPMQWYTWFKFGVADYNEFEFENYRMMMRKLPVEAHKYFARIFDVVKTSEASVSVSELVRDADGQISRTLQNVGMVADAHFWNALAFVRDALIEKGIPYFDALDANIVVKQDEFGPTPMFVDVKRVGANMYPFQPWLHVKSCRAAKTRRSFDRLLRYAPQSEPRSVLF